MLSHVIRETDIQIRQIADNWKDAIYLAANPLVERAAIELEYIDDMVTSVEENGPYMVVGPGIALAHAAPGKGVNEVCISIMTLERPVEFGNEDFDPVDLIIAFGTTSATAHVDALQELAIILQDPESLQAIRGANSPHGIYKLFRQQDDSREMKGEQGF